jgi:tetratricopeptide (TPR) repeat protein
MMPHYPRPVRYRWATLLCGALSLLACAVPCVAEIQGFPASVRAYDSREVAMLPEYCKFTQEFRDLVPGAKAPDEAKRWASVFGETFKDLHHYCWGLMKTNRALILARTRQDRQFYLADSIGEFDYVIDHATREFVLLPEILTRKGENLLSLGRAAQGVAQLRQAIELKPDYWPPYGALSDFYMKNGETAKARETLDEGLSRSPEAAALKRRLAELDAGKRATPSSNSSRSPR